MNDKSTFSREEPELFISKGKLNCGRQIIGLRKIFTKNTTEFCNSTTLHGLKYVVDKDLCPLERLFFVISFIIVVGISCFFSLDVYRQWSLTPVILSINHVPTVITKEPFPAVTICNLNLALKSKVNQFKNNSIEFAMVQTICNREVNMTVVETLKGWNILEEFIINISQPCSSLLLSCRFGAIAYNCSEIFHPIVTDCGLCCVFNMVHPNFMYLTNTNILNVSYSDGSVPIDWDPERGYPTVLPPKYYPRPAAGNGEYLGFTVILNLEADEYYCSSSNGMGFKIFLHSPTETTYVKDVGLFIAPGTENKLRIRAQKLETDLRLRSMPKQYRKCLFNNEGDLKYFSYYTKRNCEMECLTRMIMKNCGCISHYMPKIFSNGSICGIKDMECVKKYRRISLLSIEIRENCHDLCWPSCFDLTFDPDIFSIPLSHNGFSVEDRLIQNMGKAYLSRNIAMAHIYFTENIYRSSFQTELIDITDFLSNIGGIMGLFMGFSFISLAEFIYFALMRPFYNLKRRDQILIAKKNLNPLTIRRQQIIRNLQRHHGNQYNHNRVMNISRIVYRREIGSY